MSSFSRHASKLAAFRVHHPTARCFHGGPGGGPGGGKKTGYIEILDKGPVIPPGPGETRTKRQKAFGGKLKLIKSHLRFEAFFTEAGFNALSETLDGLARHHRSMLPETKAHGPRSLIAYGLTLCDAAMECSPEISSVSAAFIFQPDRNEKSPVEGTDIERVNRLEISNHRDRSGRPGVAVARTLWYKSAWTGGATDVGGSASVSIATQEALDPAQEASEGLHYVVQEGDPNLVLPEISRLHRALAIYMQEKASAEGAPVESVFLDAAREAYEMLDRGRHNKHLNWVKLKVIYKDRNSLSHGWALSRDEYEGFEGVLKDTSSADATGHTTLDMKRAYIALGSNLGDRVKNIELACRALTESNLTVLRTSALYETAPMYVLDQSPFINAVCEVKVPDGLGPIELLRKLQSIETSLGRQKTVEKGPRNIDLDIALYGDMIYEDHDLSIPHKLLLEREFVLRPLNDLVPNAHLPSTMPLSTVRRCLERVPKSTVPLASLTPVARSQPPLIPQEISRRTQIMAILNMTPDSFSDSNDWTNLDNLEPILDTFEKSHATFVDIGGQSTRPNAPMVTAEEEIARVVPVIKHTRARPGSSNIIISVDTFRASVATAAIEAGADIVNDVSAGLMDLEMLPVVAKLGCTIVLMHSRGTPATMTKMTDYPGGLIPTIADELLARVAAAEAAGIFRWRIVLDPGIGFAKTQAQNLEILHNLDKLRSWPGLEGFPWLVGTSRKRFIGRITEVEEASQRTWGTAAAITAAVQGGADIVRVHDVAEMSRVVKMADAIWRVEKDASTAVNTPNGQAVRDISDSEDIDQVTE